MNQWNLHPSTFGISTQGERRFQLQRQSSKHVQERNVPLKTWLLRACCWPEIRRESPLEDRTSPDMRRGGMIGDFTRQETRHSGGLGDLLHSERAAQRRWVNCFRGFAQTYRPFLLGNVNWHFLLANSPQYFCISDCPIARCRFSKMKQYRGLASDELDINRKAVRNVDRDAHIQ